MDTNINELSFIDNNAFIGRHHNPYVQSPFEVKHLKENNKASGVLASIVYHSASVLYDPAYGNKLLVEKVQNRTGMYLVWIAVPEYFLTESKTEKFFTEVKINSISAVKIFPRYQNYTLINGSMDNFLAFLNGNRIPLLVDQEEISWEEIIYIVKNFPGVVLALQNVGYRLERYISPLLSKYENFYMDLSRYQAHGGIEYLCSRFGSERLLFGSAMPLFSPEPIMTMIAKAKISLQEKQNISSKNLLGLLENVKK